MKEIKAYIRKDRAGLVIHKLEEADVNGMTILDANALAGWADKKAYNLSIEYVQKYSTIVKIELICEDHEVEKLANVITEAVKTGTKGDGWVFVSDIEKSIRIKTGEIYIIT